MHLKTLTLKGFKSFAEATTLDLEPGITVVVGPNGSGKSNVVDAVAWVLGAQGPRTVRGSKMEDVIFAGTANKAPLGRAEVSLTIDNSDGYLEVGFTEVTITRTLFRSGDSEYAINGVPCRLLDIQELLSDSGVGRQQHVIVSQGQIDAVLNAKPEDRRLVIEEAAGVLKYRKRREKAQRRLEATEANYLRLQDLLREVRRQLRPLERQADAARRHGALVAELAALRKHLAGRELEALRARVTSNERARADLAGQIAEVRGSLRQLDSEVSAGEAALAAEGADDLSDVLVRYESLRERVRGVVALVEERRRSVERERAAIVDASVVASLEADQARLRGELEEVDAALAELGPEADDVAATEATLAELRLRFREEWGDNPPGQTPPRASAAEVRGELAELRRTVEQGVTELRRLEERLAEVDAKTGRLTEEADRLADDQARAEAEAEPLAHRREEAAAARSRAERSLEAAEEALRHADAAAHQWGARADALAQALDEARARAGAERLHGVDGVVGTLLDLVHVDVGWEAAFEAAAGEAIAAVVVRDLDSGRRAVAHLQAGSAAGAVIALGATRPAAGLPFVPGSVGQAVRDHVRPAAGDPDVATLLDALLAHAVTVEGGWEEALDLALVHPSAVVVTRAGDRFSPTGWRTGASGAGATGAALEEAERQRRRAEAARDAALSDREDARAAALAARDVADHAVKADADNQARLSSLSDRQHRADAAAADAAAEAAARRAELAEKGERLERSQRRLAELAQLLPALEQDERFAKERAEAYEHDRERLAERAANLAVAKADLEVRAAGLSERRASLERRLIEIDTRLTRLVEQRAEAERGRTALERKAVALARLADALTPRLQAVDDGLARVRTARREQSERTRALSERLSGLRRDRQAAEQELSALSERSQRCELDAAELRVRLEQAVERIRHDFDCEPDDLLGAPSPELPEGTTATTRARELERELRIMGPINPLALEEFQALQERHEFLEAQLDDVRTTRRELAKVIRAIDAEIVEVFAAAFSDVAQNFTQLFSTLFPGGAGRLRLTDPDDLLDTGIEVEAKPSGKNVRQLSLLSGGERSLTALAFLFAVFRARPSPFYLMDEVEAALDDVNLHRFLDLIDEFRRDAQLVIVSHQKRTMEAADCLYGVTMQSGGSSKVVSERVGAG